ncbi:MAG: GNAT family N-acetyltransferase [Gemmatimonadaceae bacterium]
MIARPVVIAPVTLSNVAMFKDVRLRALLDTPTAFGSTYARECEVTDVEWIGRAERWDGERGIGFLAIDDGRGCGIAGSLIEDADRAMATLVSMWTAPTHRRRGVARQLVDRVMLWAAGRGAAEVQLMVTSNNAPAIAFYERLGFARTGLTEPYPNDPSLVELEMRREL